MVQVEAREFVEAHPGITRIGHAGWFAKGLVYLIAGLLAILVALRSIGWHEHDEGGEASPTGAIKEVAEHGFGAPVLVALAIGLIVYSGWRLVSAVMPGAHELKIVVVRIGYVVSAIMYSTFAFTALKLVRSDPDETNGNSSVSDLTKNIMGHTGGRILIGVVGAVLLGAAVYRGYKGWTEDVTQEMDQTGMSERRLLWTKRLGAVGEIGRGLALALIGFFLLRAAILYEGDEATGLDGALRRAAAEGWSRVLVAIVAVGFVSYGVFCLATFTRRRFEAPT